MRHDTNELVALEQVFGIRATPIESYVERQDVDGRFSRALDLDGHIVIYGSSKQGKTALRQKHISEDGCTTINCSPKSTTEGIYRTLLNECGIKLQTTESTTEQATGNVAGKVGFKALIPFLGGGDAEATASSSTSQQTQLTWEFIGYDLADAQTIARLLKRSSINKFVVLENFHYLSKDTQGDLAFDLKTFHELGIRFIILGVWQEANLLLLYNPDLQDRVIEVPVEPWADTDFDRVITKGCERLNCTFSESICRDIKDSAFGNIGLLQEFCRLICESSGIIHRQQQTRDVSDPAIARDAIASKLADQKNHLLRTLQSLAAQSRKRTDEGADEPLVLPFYLVHALLTMPINVLKDGISKRELQEHIQKFHHRKDGESPRSSDMTNLLNRLPTYQNDTSPFLYYNPEDRRLRIVDQRHFFALSRLDRAELLEEIPFPLRLDDE